jgi:tetratricopeptide (TPR) repeat protein
MALVTCSRCFAVFEAEEGAPGAAPLCPSCAGRSAAVAATLPIAPIGERSRRRGRPGRRVVPLVAALALLAAAVGAGAWALRRRAPAEVEEPTVVEQVVADWRVAGLLKPTAVRDASIAAARVDAGYAALAADLPTKTTEALRAFREALAHAPRRADAAIAGYATAFADAAGDESTGAELRTVHDLVRAGDATRPDLQAALARVLLLVPSPRNEAEALSLATRAAQAAPADPSVRLALGLARLPTDPAAAARTLEEAAQAMPADRRLLVAAARARWAAGDAPGALALADRRLALDPHHPGALALRAEVLAASDRPADARAALQRWAAAEPDAAQPHLLLARLAYQRDDDLGAARRHLEDALARKPDDFTLARVHAHRAAIELAAGDTAAAQAAVTRALERVPASAPARFQAAILAFLRSDAAVLREAAGVLGDRGGPVVARSLAARSAELTGTDEEAQQAYRALAGAVSRDPGALLGVSGALARLRASGPALEVARRALERDVAEGRLRRPPTEFWEGPTPLVEASRRLEAIGQSEPGSGSVAYAAAAACELLLGRTVAAERLAKLASAASPQAATPVVLLAQIALDRGDARRALALSGAALDVASLDPVALTVRARALEALGRNLDAEKAYRAAAEAGPDLATPRLALARLLAKRGAAAEAAALAAALLREDPALAEARGALLALASAAPPGAASP